MEQLLKLKAKLLNSNLPILQSKIVKKLIVLLFSRNFLRYLIIGFTTFAMQIGLLYLFTNTFGFEKIPGNICSTLLSMIFNFTMSNYWTFKAGSHKQAQKLGKYGVLATINYVFDTLIAFPLLAVTLGINQYITKVMITAMIVSWNYFLYKFWVFKTA